MDVSPLSNAADAGDAPTSGWATPPPDPQSIRAANQPPVWASALVCLIIASMFSIILILGWGIGARTGAASPPMIVLALIVLALITLAPLAGILEVLWATMRGERVTLAVLPPLLLQRADDHSGSGWDIRRTRLMVQSVVYDLSDYQAWARATQRSYRWSLSSIIAHALMLLSTVALVVPMLRLPVLLVIPSAAVVVLRLMFFIEPMQRAMRGTRALAHPGLTRTRHLATQWVASALYIGIPPAAWHADVVQALAHHDPATEDDATARYYAYLYALATGDIEAAGRSLERGLTAVQPIEVSMRYVLSIESAFLEAWYRQNPVRALQWISTLPKAFGGIHQMTRAKAAILLAEGRVAEGLELARKALHQVQSSPPGAVGPADEDILTAMIAAAEARLRPD
jgi:hypothetical protein